MDEILELLRREASQRWGREHSLELETLLQRVAADLFELSQFPLEPDDVP